jgi:hypothetical protein
LENKVVVLQKVRVRSTKSIVLTINPGADLAAIARGRYLHLSYFGREKSDFVVVQVDLLVYDRFIETEDGLIGFTSEEPLMLDDQILENTPVTLTIPLTVQKVMVDNPDSLIINNTNAEVVFTP